MNLANLLEGPAVVQYRGITLEFRGGLKPTASTESFEINTDRHGVIDNRRRESSIKLSGTPVGVWTDAHLAVLYPEWYRNPAVGQLVTRVLEFEEVTAGSNQVKITAHLLRAGCPVSLGTFGTLPAGLAVATTYYVYPVDADHITFHLAEADALTGANPVDITDAGTDEHRLVEQEPLTVWTSLGRKIVFHVGALTKMPELTFSPLETLMGGIEFECFRKNDVAPTTDNSLYTVSKAALNVTPPSAADIPTQEYALSWGAVAPWASFQSRSAVKFSPEVSLEAVESIGRGVLSRKITGGKASLTCQPGGISESAMLAALKLQGAGAGRGTSLTGNPFNIVGTGVYARMYQAQLQEVPMNFDPQNPRAGDLKWVNGRTYTNNVADPIFYVGTGAPA